MTTCRKPYLPTDSPRIEYKALGDHLSTLPLRATCADLADHLRSFGGVDWLVMVVDAMDPTVEWLKGLKIISWLLHDENPRFDRGVFEDWATDAY